MIKDILVRVKGGILFDESALRCAIYDNNYAFGSLFVVMGVFAAYILYFRPDIHKEVNALIWLFRVIFPFGFGLAGLFMLGRSAHTVFNTMHGTFVHTRRTLFIPATRRGMIGDVTRIVLDAQIEGPVERPGGETGRYRHVWHLTLSMNLGEELITLRKWDHTIEGNRPPNEAVDRAKGEAERLAGLIGRPLALAWEKTVPQ